MGQVCQDEVDEKGCAEACCVALGGMLSRVYSCCVALAAMLSRVYSPQVPLSCCTASVGGAHPCSSLAVTAPAVL